MRFACMLQSFFVLSRKRGNFQRLAFVHAPHTSRGLKRVPRATAGG